jgi:hypothetical protein
MHPSNIGFTQVAAVVFLSLAPAIGRAQSNGAAPPIESIEQLACLRWCELETLYRQAKPGSFPAGYARGIPLYDPVKRLSGPRGKVTGVLWRGKHFSCCDQLINQWCGVRAIRAQLYEGESWLDGGPALIMDYRDSSWVWSDVRDEIREVAPGIFLGIMFQERCPGPKLKMFFGLDARSAPCP